MTDYDVLILGSGLSGSMAALALARQGVKVVLASAGPVEETSHSYRSQDGIAHYPKGEFCHRKKDDTRCSRAVDQLITMGPECVEEILLKDLMVDFDRGDDGEVITYGESPGVLKHRDITGRVILEALKIRLAESPLIETLDNHTAVELITLEHHSAKYADLYKKPTCLGAYLYDQKTGQVTPYQAKETIIATGGVGQLYRYTTNPKQASGSGIAMAHRAGARIINLSNMNFLPTAIHVGESSCQPLPEEMLPEGESFYQRLTQGKKLHIDLPESGYSCTVVPAADATPGGIAVDKTGQTSVKRLRAIGRAACTGAHGKEFDRSIALLESIMWAVVCADDVAKQIRKFAYYFPSLKPYRIGEGDLDESIIQQDIRTLQQTMSDYAGIETNKHRLQRARSILSDIRHNAKTTYSNSKVSMELIQLRHTLYLADLVTADLSTEY